MRMMMTPAAVARYPLAVILQRVARGLQVRGCPGPVARLVRAVLIVPVVALTMGIAAWRARRGVSVRVESVLLDGSRFPCRLPDIVQTYLHLFGIWEPDITRFVSRRLREGATFVDVGAHVGYFTRMAARLVGPRGQVVAIEASPPTFDLLRANLEESPERAWVRLVPVAVSGRSGRVRLSPGPGWNPGMTSTRATAGDGPEVEALPLDEILSAKERAAVTLLKCDLEGSEEDAIAGMLRLVAEAPPELEILLEITPCHWRDPARSPEEVLGPLLAAGFHVYRVDNDYGPGRYLWPECARPPRRVRGPLREVLQWPGQADLVLSRRDQDCL